MILSHFVLYVRNFTFQLHGLVVLLGLVIIFFMGGDPFHVNNYWDHFHSFSDCTLYYHVSFCTYVLLDQVVYVIC